MTTETSGPSAKVICDSVNEQGHRLVTMEVRMHRFILAEMNTHRVFSRNSASSRAIPYHKIRNRIVDNLAVPVKWASEQKGMSGGDELVEPLLNSCKVTWDLVANECVRAADVLHEMGLHKSLINRLLEPFMWHTAIITATEWDNFFHQRCDPAAQPEMKAVADQMQLCYFSSTPKELAHGEWHLPYIDKQDWDALDSTNYETPNLKLMALKSVSVARCARVSYLTHDGIRDIQQDINLFDKLKTSGHWSPFEHVATPLIYGDGDEAYNNAMSGNFVGWRQYRKEFRGENRTRFLPNLPELAQTRMRMEGGLPR